MRDHVEHNTNCILAEIRHVLQCNLGVECLWNALMYHLFS